MPFVLMAVISAGVAVWLFGFPFRQAAVVRGDQTALDRATSDRREIGLRRRLATDVPVSTGTRPVGVRGWLFGYVFMLGVQALHGLALTIAALIVAARPSLAGLNSFGSLPSLLFYEVSNVFLFSYTVWLYVLMVKRRKLAIASNVACNALALLFLVCWHVLGMKSAFGVVVDGLPSVVGICYILTSRRVRNTFTVT